MSNGADDRRRQAVARLRDLGATPDEIEQFKDDLGYLAAQLVNGGRPTMTRRELAERCNVPLSAVNRVSLALGLPDVGADDLSVNDDDVVLIETFAAASALFGEDTAIQLARVVGSATGKMAQAIVSVFRSIVAVDAAQSDASGLAMVESNVALADLRPAFMAGVDQLLQRHVLAATRPLTNPDVVDRADLTVGFLDLVGSTAMVLRLTMAQLSAALAEFEGTACDIVVSRGGRVVKFIGDEIMFTAPTPEIGSDIATVARSAFTRHRNVQGIRGALASGPVLIRDGDCFGTVVNLAARLAASAEPGQILVDSTVRDVLRSAGRVVDDLGTKELKGFDEPIAVYAL